MKLGIKFGMDSKAYVVEWDKEFKEFPQFVTVDGQYWQWTFYDKDETGQVEQVLVFGRVKESVLPVNMFGILFPVPDFKAMFGISDMTGKPCECGAKFSSFPDHHMDKCPRFVKQ